MSTTTPLQRAVTRARKLLAHVDHDNATAAERHACATMAADILHRHARTVEALDRPTGGTDTVTASARSALDQGRYP